MALTSRPAYIASSLTPTSVNIFISQYTRSSLPGEIMLFTRVEPLQMDSYFQYAQLA